jgi:hypothetical protein
MTFLQPDDTWNYFSIASETDFTSKYFLEGKFHSQVPEEIVEDYAVVERLLYYSYYYYPLLDEAFAKSTRIFEASVTLKLEKLGMKKEGFESLNSKLKRLENHSSKDLFAQWQSAREMRNIFAHQKAGTLMGMTLIKAFKHNLNMINSVFLSPEMIQEKENHLKTLLNQTEHFTKGLFILEYKNQKILIQGLRPYTTGILKNKNKSLWVFIPITGDKEIRTLNDFPSPIILKLEDVKISHTGLEAIESETKERVSLYITNSSDNIEKLKQHIIRLEALESKDSGQSLEYMALLKHTIGKAISDFLYEDW